MVVSLLSFNLYPIYCIMHGNTNLTSNLLSLLVCTLYLTELDEKLELRTTVLRHVI